jgi:hypothetical protein
MPMQHEENPWKTLDSEKVYESAWIAVNKHNVLNPANNPAIYSTIHFKNKGLKNIAKANGFETNKNQLRSIWAKKSQYFLYLRQSGALAFPR